MSNSNLRKAAVSKNDEFYTQLTDIEKEMVHYKRHFKGKTVFCPCDDPHASQFFQYFSKNFEHLGLKRLITACYKSTDPFRMSHHDTDRAMWLEYTGDKNGNRLPDPDEIGVHYFEGDGDFRSDESLELLREADIIVTNPPFSLFRDFMDVMITEKKKFLVVGNFNAVKYKEIWPYVRDNKMWVGMSPRSMDFITPDGVKSVNACWFTNMTHKKRSEEIVCYQRYDQAEYPEYDNYCAIEVSNTQSIPCDYKGVMGVPITFLDKYNPKQFEIVGLDRDIMWGHCPQYAKPDWNGTLAAGLINGKEKYARILIRHRKTA